MAVVGRAAETVVGAVVTLFVFPVFAAAGAGIFFTDG